jgi:hypothetical protein
MFDENCNIIIGSKSISTISDSRNHNGSRLAVLERNGGIGGFVGCTINTINTMNNNNLLQEISNCATCYNKNGNINIGFSTNVASAINFNDALIASTERNALAGIGGFYGFNYNFKKIVDCAAYYYENQNILFGFWAQIKLASHHTFIGNSSLNDGVSGFGGFGGLTIYDNNNIVNSPNCVINKCDLQVFKNQCISIGYVLNIELLPSSDTSLIGYSKLFAGFGGFLGEIVAYDTSICASDCSCLYKNNIDISIGIVANVPKIINNSEIVLLDSGTGIGGFSGGMAEFVDTPGTLLNVYNCKANFECNEIVALGAALTTDEASFNNTPFYSGIGGFCGYVQGGVTIDVTNISVYAKNKFAQLIYKSFPASSVHEQNFIGLQI